MSHILFLNSENSCYASHLEEESIEDKMSSDLYCASCSYALWEERKSNRTDK